MKRAEKLKILYEQVSGCQNCILHTTRRRLVFGEGNPESPVVFVGEGPGREEDEQGRPFVGRSGRLLTAMIEECFGKPREFFYIANIVKCRPTVNLELTKDRPPDKSEIAECLPVLQEQLKIIEPRAIVSLGGSSAKTLLATMEGITRLRGVWKSYEGIPLMPTFHPSFLLRNGGEGSNVYREMMSDLMLVKGKVF